MSVPVLFVLLPNVLMLDLAGPAEVLRLAAQVEDPAVIDFDLQYVSPVESLQTSIGLP
ncbi:GlxA family transcriptional regulator, partial [Corynebacterium propinquum]